MIDDIAAEWAARLDARALTEAEQAELDAWLAQDPRCLGAFARARAVMVDLSSTRAAARPTPSRRALLWGGGGAIAAGVAGLATIAVHPPVGHRQRFESLLGEIRHIPLDDGSRITLNTDSALSVEFTATRRLVRLLRGEAYFEVAKAADRPFIVCGPFVQVRTVGTAYNVRLADPHTMQVDLISGRVALENPPSPLMRSLQGLSGGWPATDDLSPVFMEAGHRATVTLPGASNKMLISIEAIADDALARNLAWRDGQLAFEGQTLAQAAAEFARYSPHRLVVADPDLAGRHISGLFATTDPAGFARAAALSLGAHVKSEDDRIVLYR
jgi:transmembrane sensor